MLHSRWKPLSSCRPQLCTCCCDGPHGGNPPRRTQQMFMVCVRFCARSARTRFAAFKSMFYACVSAHARGQWRPPLHSRCHLDNWSFAITEKTKERGARHNGHFLNARCFFFFLVLRGCFICEAAPPVVMMIMKGLLWGGLCIIAPRLKMINDLRN